MPEDIPQEENNPPAPPQVSVSPKVSHEKVEPQVRQDTTDWRAKYNGLQGHAQKMQNERDKALGKNTELVTKHEAELTGLNTQVETLTSERDTLSTEAEQLREEVTELKREKEIRALVRKDFPALADLFEEGLLRTEGLEGDELKEYLTRYNQRESARADQVIREGLSGSTPPAPSGADNAAVTAAELKQMVMNTDPRDPDYPALWEKYKAALRQKEQ